MIEKLKKILKKDTVVTLKPKRVDATVTVVGPPPASGKS
tara:strand:+ start:992 stop:1108 length:117 start_codon:yes stop_codon:yes gene_type:complete